MSKAQSGISEGGQCERKLALVMEIDRVRDEIASDPQEMLVAIVQIVTEAVKADAGLLVLADDTWLGEPAVTIDPNEVISALDPAAFERTVQTATSLHTIATLEPSSALQKEGVLDLLASPLTIKGQRLGTMVYLARRRRFDEGDMALVAVAASQADSAVMQAQTWRQLEDRNRQLNAIYQVDRIRDRTTKVDQLVVQVADLLVETLDAELCMVGLVDEESGEVLLKAVDDRKGALPRLGQVDVQRILDRAIALDVPASLSPDPAFAALGFDHLLGAPLIVEGERLGVFVLADSKEPFSSSDLDLVRAVASQMDSAVVYTRTFRHMEERARQLETIYQIDRIRDETNDVQEILSAVSSTVTSALDADLCLVSLVDEEDGRSELRAVEDRQTVFGTLSKDAIRQAIDWASGQKEVASLARGSPLPGLRYLLGAPFVVAGERLGALVLARSRRPFAGAERGLLRAAVSQTDSAVIQARTWGHLEQRNKELEALYRVDHIRDQGLEFGMMLSAVLSELCSVIRAEMGFIMLFDQEGRQLELRASTADDILATSGHYKLIQQAANEALRRGELYVAQNLDEWLDSIMCIPLILRDKVIGVFGVVNRHGPGGFGAEDKRLLLAITSQVDTAIFESLERRHIREAFQRYVEPHVVERMLTMPEKDFLKGERAVLTTLFSDMRGFTSLSERIDVDVMVEMLNMHLAAMTEVVMANEGTLDKFVADEVVAIFGAPLPMEDHAFRAVRTALKMQAAHQELISTWKRRGYDLPPIGIGVNTGEMVVGNVGCEKQMDYTVIGDAVNLASRICGAAASGQVLITDATFDVVADRIIADKLPKIRVKNKEHPVQVYQVNGIR